jgi:hypothetical protein
MTEKAEKTEKTTGTLDAVFGEVRHGGGGRAAQCATRPLADPIT